MHYEITFPDCPMIEQEKLTHERGRTAVGNKIRLREYAADNVARFVADEIDRAWWCELHQNKVDEVRAMLNDLSNCRDWQLCLLREAAQQIAERRTPPDFIIRPIDAPPEGTYGTDYEKHYVKQTVGHAWLR